MNITIYTFKEPDEFGGQWGATTSDKPFELISGFDDSELGAVKEFCTALIGFIEVCIEDTHESKAKKSIFTFISWLKSKWNDFTCLAGW